MGPGGMGPGGMGPGGMGQGGMEKGGMGTGGMVPGGMGRGGMGPNGMGPGGMGPGGMGPGGMGPGEKGPGEVPKPGGSREAPAPDPEPELPPSDDPLEKRKEKEVEVRNKIEQKKQQREREKQQRENDVKQIKDDIEINRKEAKRLEALGTHKLKVREVEVPVYVEKPVHKEVIEYVDITKYVDKIVKKRWEVPVVKEKWVEVPVDKIVYKEKKVIVEKIVEVEVDEIVGYEEYSVPGWKGSFDEWTEHAYKAQKVHEERIPVELKESVVVEKQLHYTEVSPDRVRLRHQFRSMDLTGLTSPYGIERKVNQITDERIERGGIIDRRYQTIQGISPHAKHRGYIPRYTCLSVCCCVCESFRLFQRGSELYASPIWAVQTS